ncbi:MAG TPA: DUF2339 domain-containing protein, partial [Candidatus Polarisedimenticolaceae bacterium]|nr:DUF2339 domain-containing protein [Candidatus Polarisedimenticolaceae bacterium]
PAAPRIDWERWIGIRGAALLGAVVLGLAGLLFFQYSIQHGLITPPLRVVLGIAVGLACLVGAELLLPRGYAASAQAIAGAGVVILYAAFWAAHALYGLIPLGAAFFLMALVTSVCCLLTLRHAAPVTAVLGLVGGFATPLLLQTQSDRPIGLFGYVLLLDLGLLAIGRRTRWPWLGLLSLGGTVLIQGLWVGTRMGGRLVLALAILAVFAVLYAVAGEAAGREQRRRWLASQAAALLLPFAFVLHFATRVDLGQHLYPVGLLLLLLSGGACWIARAQGASWVSIGAAAGSVGVVALWLFRRVPTGALAWEGTLVAVGLALAFHVFVELDAERSDVEGPVPAALAASSGFFLVSIVAFARGEAGPLWAPLAGWAALTGLLYRQATLRGRAALQPLAALLFGSGLALYRVNHPTDATFLAVILGAAIALQVAALLRRDLATRRLAEHAAAAGTLVPLASFWTLPSPASLAPPTLLAATLALGALIALAATRLGSGRWYAVAAAATVLAHSAWTFEPGGMPSPQIALLALLQLGAAVVLFAAWPALLPTRLAADRWTWIAAALAGPAWFPALKHLFQLRFGSGAIGVLPLGLGALALGVAFRARSFWPASAPQRRSALVWLSAVALSFLSVAIPLQLQKEWITLGWALEGLAILALWRRFDHPGLKYYGLALLLGATARLVVNPAVLGYYPRSGWPVFNWLLYTYLVPAAALLGSSALLRRDEIARQRDWESGLCAGRAAGAVATALAAIVVIFVWINLAILDWFSTGPSLQLSLAHLPARDLACSIAWALYALALLGIGMARGATGLRWLSLGFLVLTIAKVFLYDLGELKDLYRVASLVGLAVSLLLVSLLYQRFVFRKGGAVSALALAVLGSTAGQAAEPAELRQLFPHEADVAVDSGALSRLELPIEVLTACRPDLSDLRIFDRDEREVPFLVDALGPPPEGVELSRRLTPEVLEAQRHERRRTDGPPQREESYELAYPGAPAPGTSWTLALEISRPEFVASVEVDGLVRGSVFRLRPGRERTRLPLPAFSGSRLRVTLVSEEPFWLEPGFRLESARVFARPGRLDVALAIVAREHAAGGTVLELERPAGLVTDLLRLETATPAFDRRVDVWDDGAPTEAAHLGGASLFRVPAAAAVEELELALRPARGERLRLRIEDGD